MRLTKLTQFLAIVLIPQVRSVYRTIELVDGWNGRIIKNELYFNIMDGAMIVAAMFCLNELHPGRLLKPDSVPVKEIASISSSSGFIEKPKEPGRFCSCIPQHIVDECSEA